LGEELPPDCSSTNRQKIAAQQLYIRIYWRIGISFMKRIVHTPHPNDIAARKALSKRPPAPVSRVIAQSKAAERIRKQGA
jgi:hypothetical protein